MIFVTIDDVDLILGDTWTDQSKKAMAVNQANVWLGAKRFCSGLDPIDDAINQAGAYLSQLSAQGKLYETEADGVIKSKRVKADTVEVQKEYVSGQEKGKSSEMQFIDDLLKPFLCGGVGKINGWVCK